jgi:replicative DNA helicase
MRPDQDFDPSGKGQPHNLEAEMSVLGAMMLSQLACDEVSSLLNEEDFFRPAHKEVFSAIRHLVNTDQGVDLVTVRDALQKRGKLAAAGGFEYLYQLNEVVPTASNAVHYASIVQDYAALRRLQISGHDIVKLVNDPALEVQEKIEKAEALVFAAGQQRLGQEFTTSRTLAKAFYQQIDEMIETGKVPKGLETGFLDLDRLTTGFYPGDLVILAARPAMGKTSLALNFALWAAESGHGAVAVFSLEMTGDQLIRRMVSTLGQVSLKHLRSPDAITDNIHGRLADACDRLYRAPIYIDDTSDISPMELKAKCRRMAGKQKLALIVVDYLQLMKGSKRTENRTQEIGEIARALKQTAKDLKVPVVALSQVNRQVESRDDKRPTLSDLRESGSIEAEADLVMAIYRGSYYERKLTDKVEASDPNVGEVAEVIVLKHRSGPTGTVLLAFQPAYTRFSTLSREKKDDYEEGLKRKKQESSE